MDCIILPFESWLMRADTYNLIWVADLPLGAAAAGESVSMLDNEPPNDVAVDDSAAEAVSIARCSRMV